MSTRPLRVVAIGITPPVFKASGGISAGIQLTRHVARLCDARFVLMATEDTETVEDNLKIVRRRSRNAVSLISPLLPKTVVSAMWRPALKDWLAHQRPDIVHLHNPHPPSGLGQVAADCRALGIPYVISTHGFVEFSGHASTFNAPAWQRPIYDRMVHHPVATAAAQAARVLALSPEEEPILRAMGVRSDRIAVVTNGVDRYYAETLADADRLRLIQRFKLPEAKPILLFVGNHTLNKGIGVLLRALPLLREDGVAVIAGAIRSPQEQKALLSAANFSGDDPRLIFTDFVTKEELRALYQTADIFVFPSMADTLPLVILEAMASGVPVIATRVGGIPFEVTSDTGILVNPGDHARLAREIDRLCADPSLRTAMGGAGRRRALELFDWDASAKKAVAIYRSVLNEAPSRVSHAP
jgi:glycosyltransferase involved in cell wall biosynthesis